jgi:hypothetical protein
MEQSLKIFYLNFDLFIILKETQNTTSNIGCFSKKSIRNEKGISFNEWLHNKISEFDFTLMNFENRDLLNDILKQNYYEY